MNFILIYIKEIFYKFKNFNLSNTLFAERFDKSETSIGLKFSLSILTLWAEVWDPNRATPLHPEWAAIWAGPVSFAITNKLSFINDDNCEIFKALPSSKIHRALISLESLISFGPGATKILY